MVSVASLNGGIATAFPSTLTFTPANYNVPQPVNVMGTQDIDLLDESIGITLMAPGIPTATVSADVRDDDMQRIIVDVANLDVNEGDSQFVYVSLAFQPVGTVFVNVGTNNTQAAPTPMMLQFDPVNYATPQPVQVFALSDPDFDFAEATLTFSGAGAMTPQTVLVTLVEPDIIEQPAFAAAYVCHGLQTPLRVRLHGRPTRPLRLDIQTTSQLSATPTSLNFDSSNWFTYQTVTVTGQNPGTGQLTVRSPNLFSKGAQIDVRPQPCVMMP
jgi:hypothetical protein